MTTLFVNIKQLIQVREASEKKVKGEEMKELPVIDNAYLLIEDDRIHSFGKMSSLGSLTADKTIDASGKIILPTWCDSHTHLVFAETREEEFVDRIHGLTYEEIALRGGGILNSAKKLQNYSEERLYQEASIRLQELIKLGTGAIEIKSGYGLSTESEIKILKVVKRLKHSFPVVIKSTFLGAHAIPLKFKENREDYIQTILQDMLPKIAKEELAEFIDVFCEKGYFSATETDLILKAGKQYGLVPKVHVNQFNAIGGVQVSVQNEALSVDHLEVISESDIVSLLSSETMPVALPSCSFFLGIPYTNGRKIIDNGLPLALASDYNPGSTPSGNMNFVVSLACIQMKLTPEEAINAASINGAYAINESHNLGTITPGKKANLILSKPIPSYKFIPYSFGHSWIEQVYINGKEM